jgi:hypothetical protein
MIPIKTWRIALPFPRNALPMLGQARAQNSRERKPRGFTRCNCDIDGRQDMLVQAEGFSRQALDSIAYDRVTAGACRYRQPQPRMSFMVCQYRKAKIRVGESSAALPYRTKFGRLVQTLARLERLFTDRWTARGYASKGRGACDPWHAAEQATADRSW